MDEHEGECNCLACQLKAKVEQMNKDAEARGAANCRGELWLNTFHERIKMADMPETAAKIAKLAVIEFDKAFPEVKTAAMAEDR